MTSLEQIQLRRAEEPKTCPVCLKSFTRHAKEGPAAFSKRKRCGEKCRLENLAARARELGAARIKVPCAVCGTPLVRGSRRGFHVCKTCGYSRRDANWRRKLLGQKEQARRYRILMTVMGFEDFAELLAYLKQVPWVELDGRRMRNLYAEAVR